MKPTPAQARVLRSLDTGQVIYAYGGVSRTTAFALVRHGLAEWAVAPHTVSLRSARPGGRIRYQLEWGIRATALHWSADPVVAAIARHGSYIASVWGTGDGDRADWCVHPDGAELPAETGSGDDLDDAKRKAEAALRRLAAVAT